jgi:hypothetical protein
VPKQLRKIFHFAMLASLASICLASHAEDFTFSVTSPDFKVVLPKIPAMSMSKHPMHSTRPHLRYLGSNGPYTVSVMTPTADAGMTAAECASSIVGQLVTRPGVPPLNNLSRVRINERTYAALYVSSPPGPLMLHAHFLSAATGESNCIEVHVSKVADSKDEVAPWFKGFGFANIETGN